MKTRHKELIDSATDRGEGHKLVKAKPLAGLLTVR